ncbi:hypothetical protein BDV25DRAFT_150355 [Aspergillus avenaceus]|uniref:Uncharacterized protein n=1 Tax=Aspergillus avenaceus TaxID=36643 RepID=A0A5N6U2P7_ASPAV|nr:hypothetical protein BDV25DRAFT_150355 [Aspergillus avenaceus]
MPPRRPVSPLSLETVSPAASDLDSDGIICSDDELSDEERAAQRRRIEKLAESYLQGKPLFILSASLRGPLDKGWVNPWKTDRRRNARPHQSVTRQLKETEIPASPVIQETNSRKRRSYEDPSEAQHRRKPAIARSSRIGASSRGESAPIGPNEHSRLDHLRGEGYKRKSASPSTPGRVVPWAKAPDKDTRLNPSTSFSHANKTWLKKDRRHISFQNVDPPTSPTPTLSSRHSVRGRTSKDASDSSQQKSCERSFSASVEEAANHQSLSQGDIDPELDVSRIPNSVTSSPAKGRYPSGPVCQSITSKELNRDNSICVAAPSSRLPSFEYRRKRDATSREKERPRSSSPKDRAAGKESRPQTVPEVNGPPVQQQSPSKDMRMAHPKNSQIEVVSKASEYPAPSASARFMGPVNVSNSTKVGYTSTLSKGHTNERLPSAQQIRGNPTMTDVTSLHSIFVPKGNSDGENDTIPDPPFSTQAALVLAQRSFQNDLGSQENNEELSSQQHSPDVSGPPSNQPNDITPFHHLSTPAREIRGNRPKSLAGVGGQWLSTQCMIDAATPFTFSTEKKESRKVMSPIKPSTDRKQQNSTGFSLPPSTPSTSSELSVEHDASPSGVPRQSHSHGSRSALAMTLTGTTPPTAQDRDPAGTDGFNLTQAIADAGSWLQESFDFSGDLKRYENAKANRPSTASTRQSALGRGSDPQQ